LHVRTGTGDTQVGTMERVVVEGEVATANTLARLLSSLPPCGKTTRVMFYDLHTLQNRFYLRCALLPIIIVAKGRHAWKPHA
jgi:hypothetical protein